MEYVLMRVVHLLWEILLILLIFGVDESSLVYTNKKNNNIYVMGDRIVQGINGTTLYAEKVHKTNFTAPNKKILLSLHYNGDNSSLFVNGCQELKFEAKTDQMFLRELCLGNISSDWVVNTAEKTGLHGNVYDFVVDPIATGVGKIYDMHGFLMIKHNI